MMRIDRSILVAVFAASLMAASACSDSSGPQAGPAAKVAVATAPSASALVGASAGTFAVKVTDASGLPVPGVAVSFSATGGVSLTPTSGTTDASGLASTEVTLGTVAGTVSVSATATGVASSVSQNISATAGPAAKIVVAPKTLRLVNVGDTARVSATAQDQFGNTAGAGTIAYSVSDPTLLSVDVTGLVSALRQGGTAFVISTSNSKSDTTTVTVLPAGSSYCTGLAGATPMAIGDVQTFTGAQYGCLSGAATGAEFAIVAFNSSTDQTSSLTASVMGNGLGVAPTTFAAASTAPALRSVIGTGAVASAPQLDESFHLKLLASVKAEHHNFAAARIARRQAAARSIIGSAGGTTISAAGIPGTAQVGDLVTLNVSANSCSNPTNHALRVAAIGTKSIVLADTLNPANGFTSADYQRIATRFDTLVYPLDVGAFGAPSDIDNNGRVAILFTRSVNEQTPANSSFFVGGFFHPRDLYPKTAANPQDACATSNEGEMFYMLVPDPTGIVNGNAHTTGFVDSLTTGIVAHEFQHLINGSRRFYINTAANDFEETWLNEGLSHIAEELLYYRESGFTPRMNLNDTTIRILNRPTYPIWKNDAASNFSRFLQYIRAPNSNSPFGNDDELETRGATWSFLRYAADRLGTTDGNIWQRFDDATVTGLATLTSVFGTDPIPLIRDWTVANYVDDLGVSSDPRFMHKSWNYRDIFTKTFLNIPTYPLPINSLADGATKSFLVRGGSAAYVRLSVPAGKEGLLTFSSQGGAPFAPLQFVVMRTK
ncbi:MAG: Ig-like domain-containing protein [bacterium]